MSHFKRLSKYVKRSARFGHNSGTVTHYEIVSPHKWDDVKREIPSHISKPPYAISGHVKRPERIDIKSDDEVNGIGISCRIAKRILNHIGDVIRVNVHKNLHNLNFPYFENLFVLNKSFISYYVQVMEIGMCGQDIDDIVYELSMASHSYPSPLNYSRFPKCVTTSVNNIAVHGIPDRRKLINGDVITVDVSVYHKGFHGDCAYTYLIGECDDNAKHLVSTAHLCLLEAINVCRDGQKLCIIGQTIEKFAKNNCLNVIPEFCGHGIGTYLHGPPQILHYHYDSNEIMRENMTFTIEPVITEGKCTDVVMHDDYWTVSTDDDARTAQFEHTICVKKDNAIILTQ